MTADPRAFVDPAGGASPEEPGIEGAELTPLPPTATRRSITEAPAAFDDWDEAPLPESEIAELLMYLEKATRAHRLYQENNPVYQGFVSHVHAAVTRLWDRIPSLTVAVEEEAFRCFGKEFPSREGRDGLPFLFYRDGVRVLTFLPGFEDEIDPFLRVIDRTRQMGPRATDDIVTLLWEEEFTAFQYSYVDLLAEGSGMPQAPSGAASREPLDRARLERVVEGAEPEPVSPAVEAGQPPVPQIVSTENFVDTMYFLEPDEVALLYKEVESEWNRDVRSTLLDALFDRLEDAVYADRHEEMVRILGQLLPAFLARGDLTNVTKILVEVEEVGRSPDIGANEREEIERLLRELSDASVLSQFLGSLEDGAIDPSDEELRIFLSYLGAEALPLLIRTVEKTESARLRDRMTPALDAVGEKHGRSVASLVGAPDEKVALGAARIAGRIGLRAATNNLIALLRKADAAGRRIAIEALAAVADAGALETVLEALTDPDREVRIAAARGLAAARFPASRDRFRSMVRSRSIREADLTEQMAVFEAYGGVATGDDVAVLDRLLNGRRLLTRESPETRSCAAMALGRIDTPAARTALLRSAKDPHPLVRNAVSKALTRSKTV